MKNSGKEDNAETEEEKENNEETQNKIAVILSNINYISNTFHIYI